MLCMGDVGKYAALQAVAFGKCHSYTGNVTTQEKNPSAFIQWDVIQLKLVKGVGTQTIIFGQYFSYFGLHPVLRGWVDVSYLSTCA